MIYKKFIYDFLYLSSFFVLLNITLYLMMILMIYVGNFYNGKPIFYLPAGLPLNY